MSEDTAATAPEPADRPTESADEPVDGLLSRLRVVEDQPLESRAEAFGHVHDELVARLEGADHGARG